MLAEAQSVSEALDIPLYRVTDKIPRLVLTEAQELEEREAEAAAAVAAAASAAEEEEEAWREEECDEGGDGSADTGGVMEDISDGGMVFEAGIARYPEATDPAPYVEPLEVSVFRPHPVSLSLTKLELVNLGQRSGRRGEELREHEPCV